MNSVCVCSRSPSSLSLSSTRSIVSTISIHFFHQAHIFTCFLFSFEFLRAHTHIHIYILIIIVLNICFFSLPLDCCTADADRRSFLVLLSLCVQPMLHNINMTLLVVCFFLYLSFCLLSFLLFQKSLHDVRNKRKTKYII